MKFIITSIILAVLVTAGVVHSRPESSNSVIITAENHVVFSGPVDQASVAKAQMQMSEISSKLDKNDVIYLILDTPGGSIMAGNQFIDFAKSLPQKVKPLSLFAASMGYQMSQAFDERLVLPSSQLMSHRASLSGMSGQFPGELNSRLQNISNILDEMDSNVARRIGISLEQYRQEIYNELWLTGSEAVKRHHADRLVKASCASDLLTETRSEQFNTIFGVIHAEFSKCPLITGPLSLKLGRNVGISVTKEMIVREVMKVKRNVTMEY